MNPRCVDAAVLRHALGAHCADVRNSLGKKCLVE